MLRDGASSEPEQANHFLGRILQSTERIEALLGDLLSLARLEARGVEDAATVDLRECVQSAFEGTTDRGPAPTIEAEGVSLVRGDASWLTRAIENLVDNARLHGQGEVRVQLLGRDHGGSEQVVCRVINEGQIARGIRGRLFRRFVTTRRDRGGTGLGLAIVRAVAEAHSGTAECTEDGPPQVIFELTFPAKV